MALYVPVGMAGHLAFLRRGRLASLFYPVLIGTTLSATVEMVQLFVPGRACSGFDLLDNMLGTVVGVGLGLGYESLSTRLDAGNYLRRVPDRQSLALLLCWLASVLFPLFPVMWLGVYRAKLFRFVTTVPEPVACLVAAATWYAVGQLMAAAMFPARKILRYSIIVVPLQFLVVTRQPTLSLFLGACAGILVFHLAPTTRLAGPIFLGFILFRGLAPFHPAGLHPFSWVPFGGFLDMEWETGIRILFEKGFLYGTAIWLLRRQGGSFAASSVIVCSVLILIEILQMWLPGHVPEVTDPVLALLIAFGLSRLAAVRPAIQPDHAP